MIKLILKKSVIIAIYSVCAVHFKCKTWVKHNRNKLMKMITSVLSIEVFCLHVFIYYYYFEGLVDPW